MKSLKSYLLLFAILFFTSSFAQQQIPNNGFENWAVDPNSGFLSPIDWTVWRGLSDSASVVQTPGFGGIYACHLSVFYDSSNSSYKSCGLYTTIPINQKPDSVAGYFKFANASGMASLNYDYTFYLTPGQIINQHFGSVPNSANWIRFAYPLSTSGVPTSMTVNFGLNSVNSTNQYAEIDDLQFIYNNTAINNIDNTITNCNLFPTISSGDIILNISCTKTIKFSLKVYNYSGKIISSLTEKTISFGNHSIPLKFKIPDGMYILNLDFLEGSKTLRFAFKINVQIL